MSSESNLSSKPPPISSKSPYDSGFSSITSLQSVDAGKLTVLVEGNIGAGKSKFLSCMQSISPDVSIYSEPIDQWKNVGGHNALDLMYKDPERWSLAFQSYVQLTMLQIHLAKSPTSVKMIERSLFSARYCFVENLHKSGKMVDFDYQILNSWYDWIWDNQKLDADLIVYLRTSPQTCLQRMASRSRTEEAEVPLEYLQTLHDLHEDWLIKKKFTYPSVPIMVLDADKSFEELQLDIKEKAPQILQCSG